MEIIDDETKWLNVLFNELLTVDQIKKGTFSYQWGNNRLDEIARRALVHLKVQFPRQNFNYIDNLPDDNKTVYSDFDKLLQVFVNLLTNAAKFSNKNTAIDLRLDDNKNKYIITVKDNGPGINKKELQNIFNGFYKGKNNTKKRYGTGLIHCKANH